MAKLHDLYKQEVIKALTEKFGYKSVMQVPRIVKITLNMGVGEAVADKKVLENAARDMTAIAGEAVNHQGSQICSGLPYS